MQKYTLIFLTLISYNALACSPHQPTGLFEVTGIESPKPVTPDFVVGGISRGHDDGNSVSCSDAGVISLKLKTTPSNPTGYLFEMLENDFEDQLFISKPISILEDYDKNSPFYFRWLDGSNEVQEPINIAIKIIAVSKTGDKSTPQYLKITHPGVKKPWWKFW
jgi:hypothetical protein